MEQRGGTGSVLAIIAARRESQGNSREYARTFLGKPLVAHSILHALESNVATKVIVWTDDVEVANIAKDYGALPLWRPARDSEDETCSASVLTDVLDQFGEPNPPALVVFLEATAPLRRPGEVGAAIETLEQSGADSLFSACRSHGLVWRYHDDRLVSLANDPSSLDRRRESRDMLLENGSIYVSKPWVPRELGTFLGGKIAVHLMDPLDSFQIDHPSDFERLERLAEMRKPCTIGHGLERIRLLVLDFDGVMTDNRVWVHQDGTESVACHRGDGLGIGRLKASGLGILVISTETNPVVAARCRKLGLESIQGCDDKLSVLKSVALERGLNPGQIAYMGNDVNDLGCLGWVGMPIAVADALPEVLKVARLITKNRGGHGAVREATDWFFAARGADSEVVRAKQQK